MSGTDDLKRRMEQELGRRQERSSLRHRRDLQPINAVRVRLEGRELVNFASNNYLGLTHHPRMIAAAHRAVEQFGVGSGAAGLISGYTPIHAAGEEAISHWKETEAAVILPSGYQANLAAVQTLAGMGRCRFLIDKLAHASLIDAVRVSGCAFRVFPHNHLDKLKRLLEESPPEEMQVVLTESIFSMDGDCADLAGLAELKEKHAFVLLLDEAHGSGVYGPEGNGYAAECGLQRAVDFSIVTLSKALGCAGGVVCASRQFCDCLLNLGRSYIYSTSVPPVIPACALAAIEVLREEPHRQRRLRQVAKDVREKLVEKGLSIPKGDSPIIPIILGQEESALAAAHSLQELGLLVVAIRPPTVPPGTSRLRITLSSEHTDGEIERLVKGIEGLKS